MRRRSTSLVLSLFFIFLFIFAVTPPAGFSQKLEDKVTVHRLRNGLTFVFMERHKIPTIATVYGFKVGAVDEVTGFTGISHILEHMAFKGTTRIGTTDFEKEKVVMERVNELGAEWSKELRKGGLADKKKIEKIEGEMKKLEEEQKKYIVNLEIMDLYQKVGGIGVNASTGIDMTSFTANLPSNQLETWCLIESERMKDPVFRQFYTERSVVQQERKQSVGSRPLLQLMEAFTATAFLAHPCRNPVIGWASDIESVTLEEVKAFRDKYYVPNNCVAALVGDVYPEKAIPLIEKYFGNIPRGSDVPEVRTVEPVQLGERRVVVEGDAPSQLRIGYHKPGPPHKDAYVLYVAGMILAGETTSRMWKDFVDKRKIANQIWAAANFAGQRYDNLFLFQGWVKEPHTNEELEKAIYEYVEKLKVEPVEAKELEKVKNGLEFQGTTSVAVNAGMAGRLMGAQLLHGDWRRALDWEKEALKVTAEDIMAAAKKYFTPENRTVGYLVRKVKGDGKLKVKIGDGK